MINFLLNKIYWWFLSSIILVVVFPQSSVGQQISLDNLSAFNGVSDAWTIAGEVFINPIEKDSFRKSGGKGILVGSSPKDVVSSEVTTNTLHGNTVLEFDVLLTHGASAEVYLQGRYGLQLTDSWNKKKLRYSDNGAIIPPISDEGNTSIGYLPRWNVAQAPGIWQHVKIVFDAPKFNSEGERVQKARFVRVEQNGVITHENKLFASPSKGALFENEVHKGPISIRINRESVAFRNIHYTTEEKVNINNLKYELYENKFLTEEFIWGGERDSIVALEKLTFSRPNPIKAVWSQKENNTVSLPKLSPESLTKSGRVDLLNLEMVKEIGSDFALVFEGDIYLPKSGEYYFESIPTGYGALSINGQELLKWDALHNKGNTSGSINLEKGSHLFRFTYVNFRRPNTGLFVEGPGIKRQSLHRQKAIPTGSDSPIIIEPADSPLIQRSFIFHKGEKLLTCMSVGHPNGVNYTVNLATGGLVQVWRGGFGDVTSMWEGRGLLQELQPLGSILSLTADQQVLLSKDSNMKISSSELETGDYKQIGYDLNEEGEPIFQYRVNNIEVQDHITPNAVDYTLTRSLRFSSKSSGTKKTLWYRLASASTIDQVSAGLYGIADKTYYIKVENGIKPVIKKVGEFQWLLVPVKLDGDPQDLRYSLIW